MRVHLCLCTNSPMSESIENQNIIITMECLMFLLPFLLLLLLQRRLLIFPVSALQLTHDGWMLKIRYMISCRNACHYYHAHALVVNIEAIGNECVFCWCFCYILHSEVFSPCKYCELCTVYVDVCTPCTECNKYKISVQSPMSKPRKLNVKSIACLIQDTKINLCHSSAIC